MQYRRILVVAEFMISSCRTTQVWFKIIKSYFCKNKKIRFLILKYIQNEVSIYYCDCKIFQLLEFYLLSSDATDVSQNMRRQKVALIHRFMINLKSAAQIKFTISFAIVASFQFSLIGFLFFLLSGIQKKWGNYEKYFVTFLKNSCETLEK